MIFVDTSFWVAIRNRGDRNHEQARALLEVFGNEGLVTSSHVRGETWTFLRRRVGHGSAVNFLDSLDQTERVRIVAITEEDEESAVYWLRQHDEREYSFVDATSFALMRRLRASSALAFDGDYSAAGFIELRP